MNKSSRNQPKTIRSKKEEIINHLLADIDEAKLARNEKIPNRKVLARRFEVDPKTVDRAIAELVEHHVLRTLPRKGTYVAPSALLSSVDLYGDEFGGILTSKQSLDSYPEYVQLGSLELNPYFFLQHCMKQISKLTLKLIQQSFGNWGGITEGHTELSKRVRENVSMREGKIYTDKNFALIGGRYHTLRQIAKLLIRPGDVVIMAAPYVLSPSLFTELGAEVWAVPRTPQGIKASDLSHVHAKATEGNQRVALVYTNLQVDYALQEPHNLRLHMQDLLNITELLEIGLVEEFEDHEITYQAVPTFADVAIKSMAHVVSVRSYSKLLAMYNEIRVVLAAACFIVLLKQQTDLGVDYGFLYDVLAVRLLEANIFMRVTEPLTSNLMVLMNQMVKSCAQELGHWANAVMPLSGVSFWITAKKGYLLHLPAKKLADLNFRFDTIEPASIVKTKAILLGMGDGATHELREAIALIAREMLRQYC